MEWNKKLKGLTRDCQAVSEIMAQVLLIFIVVLAFSAIALVVYSDEGAMDTTHTPHTNLQENLERSKNTVRILHSGGEAVDLKDVKIILSVNGTQAEFNMTDFGVKIFDPDGRNLTPDDVFKLGDYIEVDPSSKISMKYQNDITLYFVHRASGQVIQKTTLHRDFGYLPYWITPNTFPDGTAYDSYTGQWLDTELVDKIDDKFTSSSIKQNQVVSENFTFGIDTEELEIPESTIFTNVLLKIVCTRHDNSRITMMPEIYNGSQWTSLAPITFSGSLEFIENTTNITEYVKNTTELKNLQVRISVDGHASDTSEKAFYVDFVGIHLDY